MDKVYLVVSGYNEYGPYKCCIKETYNIINRIEREEEY